MSTVYEAINDCVLSEEGGAIVKDAEGRAYNALRSIQEQNRFILSTEYEVALRPDEDRWMEERFSSTPEAKHSGKGKRHGWKYRTYMPKKYWNARTLICRAIDKGLDITGMGKSELQNVLSGKKDSDSSTETTSTNLDKFKKSVIKINTYFSSLPIGDRGEAINFFSDNCILIKDS
jgi:hypothetical protein